MKASWFVPCCSGAEMPAGRFHLFVPVTDSHKVKRFGLTAEPDKEAT